MKYTVFLISLFFILGSCNQAQNNKDTSTAKNIFKEYYENGNLKSEISYVDSLMNGKAVWYYENGTIRTMQYYRNGIIEGEAYFYYESSAIEQYDYYDFNGTLRFRVKYNYDSGEILEIEGKSLYIGYNSKKDSLNINDTFSFSVFVASPPKTKTIIEFGEIDNKNIFSEKKEYAYKGEIPLIKYNFESTGTHKIMVVAKILSKNQIELVSDTAFVHANVVL